MNGIVKIVITLAIIAIVLGFIIGHAEGVTKDVFIKEADKYKAEASILKGIMFVESKFKHNSVSSKGAVGVMQIVPRYWIDELKSAGIIKNKRDLMKPDKHVRAGVYIFRHYYASSNGNVRKALTKYSGKRRGYASEVLRAVKYKKWED